MLQLVLQLRDFSHYTELKIEIYGGIRIEDWKGNDILAFLYNNLLLLFLWWLPELTSIKNNLFFVEIKSLNKTN